MIPSIICEWCLVLNGQRHTIVRETVDTVAQWITET
jgi:hypothetical protein